MRTEIYVNTTLRQLDNHKCVPRGTPPPIPSPSPDLTNRPHLLRLPRARKEKKGEKTTESKICRLFGTCEVICNSFSDNDRR